MLAMKNTYMLKFQVLNTLERHSDDFTGEDKFTYPGEHYLTSENSYIMSSVSPEGLRQVWENYPDDVIRVISAWTWRLEMYNTKAFVKHIQDVQFVKRVLTRQRGSDLNVDTHQGNDFVELEP